MQSFTLLCELNLTFRFCMGTCGLPGGRNEEACRLLPKEKISHSSLISYSDPFFILRASSSTRRRRCSVDNTVQDTYSSSLLGRSQKSKVKPDIVTYTVFSFLNSRLVTSIPLFHFDKLYGTRMVMPKSLLGKSVLVLFCCDTKDKNLENASALSPTCQ